MRQSLSLNWQEYQTRRPKDPFTFPSDRITGTCHQARLYTVVWGSELMSSAYVALYYHLYNPYLLVLILQKYVPFVPFKYCLKYQACWDKSDETDSYKNEVLH